MNWRYLVMLTALVLSRPLQASSPQLTLNRVALDQAMQPAGPRAQSPFSGIVLVAQQGKLLWNFSNKARPLTAQRQFIIGSQAKQITAALILQAVDQQRLALQDPLIKFLPEQRERFGDVITIKHLLEHSSGLGQGGTAPAGTPGSTFAYSNAGYDLLGEVLERVYGEPFAAQVARLFRRCEMTHSFAPSAQQLTSQAPSLVAGLTERAGQLVAAPLDVPFSNNPSGRLVSSAGDLIRWQQCLHQQALLTQSSYQQMTSPQMLRPHRWGALGYGFGLQISQSDGLTEYSHSGFVDGYISTTLYYPQFATGLVLLEPLSLDPADIQRAFYYHDQVRQALREQLLAVGALPK
jgi:CubicO group peptidase (beta-lactamase class C family)